MKYFEYVVGDYITQIGTGAGPKEIDKERYYKILELIKERPTDSKAGEYMLTTSLKWVLVSDTKDGEK